MAKVRTPVVLTVAAVLFLMVLAVITGAPVPAYADQAVYAIGDAGPADGLVFYDKGFDSDGWRYLEVSFEDPGLNPRWHNDETTFIGGTSAAIGYGMANTLKILALPDANFNASKWCANLSISRNGVIYDDWFLPSFDELTAVFSNLDYNFQDWPYWTSTERDASQAWWVYEDLSDNISSGIWYKNDSGNRALAIRAFSALQPSPVINTSWVRHTEMKCKNVWINEEGNFQFSFIYPYADNNWVKIYDMEGNLVYEVDMPLNNPNIIVDLPDGIYTVKTFNDQPEPLQEFVIGKP